MPAIQILASDRTGLLSDVAAIFAENGCNISDVRVSSGEKVELVIEFEPAHSGLVRLLETVDAVSEVKEIDGASAIFGKRVIVIGGGAQVAQVVLGAVTEADRHNIRGERISVDTIPLTGEAKLAEAVRAVARLPRAKVLVLAGSLMGGDVTEAVRELAIPVISLNMVGSVKDAADLVISDPVQAGVMAVLAIADTATFDLARQKGKVF
jgi:energy-converting hydrogenase B subunit Q